MAKEKGEEIKKALIDEQEQLFIFRSGRPAGVFCSLSTVLLNNCTYPLVMISSFMLFCTLLLLLAQMIMNEQFIIYKG